MKPKDDDDEDVGLNLDPRKFPEGRDRKAVEFRAETYLHDRIAR